MWHPNKQQWIAIWVAFFLSLLTLFDVWDGYRSRREDHEIAIFLAGGGALLVWFLERRPLRAGGIIGILIGLFWLVLVLSQDF